MATSGPQQDLKDAPAVPDDHSDEGLATELKEKLAHPFPGLRTKLKHTPLYDLKVKASHLKHKLGKLENLVNPNHRHDEKHEQETDERRSKIAEGHRFDSFAPVREGNIVKWYVDGRDYFWAVSVALERAKETIYIADWWLSPELFLRRPPYFNQEWRLDQILKRRAEAGVKIYIIVYKEVSPMVTCNSAHTKRALTALCPKGSPGHGNIRVMRHPDHNVFENLGDMTFYWAHHEKFIVIDYNMAFIGGLDQCFGRWDQRQHPLSDVHPSGVQQEVWPGQDFNNNRIMDFQSVEDWKSNQVSKAEYGRMPWHDVAMGLIGPSIYDIAEHFVLRWNFCKRDKYKRDERYDWLTLEGRDASTEEEMLVGVQRPKFPVGDYVHHPLTPLSSKPLKGNEGTVTAQIVRSSADWSSGILTEHSIQNAYCEIIRNAQHYVYIENQFFITATGEHQAPIHNIIGGAIVDAVARAAEEKRKFRVIILLPAIPGFAGDLRKDAATGTRAIMDYQYKSINRGEHSIYGQLKERGIDPTEYIYCFNLRSYDRLNFTPQMKQQEEKSGVDYKDVQRANAEEIMSGGLHHTTTVDSTYDSPSSEDEKDRKRHRKSDDNGQMERQHLVDQQRRFEEYRSEVGLGEGGDTEDSIAKCAMAGEQPLSKQKWAGDGDDAARMELENYVQEELYIHGKVCIVDDRVVLCGSSNINDRSQLGFHDSELTIVLEDERLIESKMNGEPYQARYLAATLRRFLWREHLGLLPAQSLDGSKDPNCQPPGDAENDVAEDDSYHMVADPLDDKLWEQWCLQAQTNTEVFRSLFHADPDNNIKTFNDYQAFLPEEGTKHKQGHLFNTFMPVDEVRASLDKIKGHLVWFPLDFLCNADMAEKGLQVNAYTESIYT